MHADSLVARAIYDADRHQHVGVVRRQPDANARMEDAWLCAKAIQERLHERVAILDQLHRVRQHHPHGHAVARSDAEVDREQMHDAADEQRAADEEDRGQRNLRDDEAGCHPSPEPEPRRP